MRTRDYAINQFRFNEARISATLSHGNVVQVFDIGQVAGNGFLVMEYMDGQPLYRLLKRATRSAFTCLPASIAAAGMRGAGPCARTASSRTQSG